MQEPPPLLIPTIGVCVGGQLDGWQYRFLTLEIHAESFDIRARMAPPKWPFPWDMSLRPLEHFVGLQQLKRTEHVKHLGFVKLDREVRAAYARLKWKMPEGIDRPEWLVSLQALADKNWRTS